MKRTVLLILFSQMFFLHLYAQITFQKTFGSSSDDRAYSVLQSADSGYVVAGHAYSFGAGMDDVFLIKTKNNADVEWIKTYGLNNILSSGDHGYSIDMTSDSGYIITGGINNNIFLIRTDKAGDTLWCKFYGGNSNDDGYSVKQTLDGGFLVVGHTYSYGQGSCDLYIIRTDNLGNLLWSKTVGGNKCDRAYAVSLTNDGGFVITGNTETFGAGLSDVWLLKFNSSGILQWNKTFGGTNDEIGYSVVQTYDGGYIISGQTNSFGVGNTDIYLIKTNSFGDTIWTKTIGTIGQHNRATSIIETIDSCYIMTGSIKSIYLTLIKINALGDTIWTKQYLAGGNVCRGESVKQTHDQGFIIAGYTNDNIYMVKTDKNGNNACNLHSTNLSLSNTTTNIGSGGTISSGGSILNESILLTNISNIDSLLCINLGCHISATFNIVNPTVACNGEITVYPNGGTPPYTYLWDANANNQTTQTADSLCPGYYCVLITDKNSCTLDTCISVEVGVSEISNTNIYRIYPNPTSRYIIFESSNTVNESCIFMLYDVMGNIILSEGLEKEINAIQIDLGQFSNGFYYYKILSENNVSSIGKIIKNH